MEGSSRCKIVLQGAVNILEYDLSKPIQNGIETDTLFLNSLQSIIRTKRQREKAEPVQLTEKQLDKIHDYAAKHSEASRFNLTTKMEFEKIPLEDRCNCGCNRGTGENIPLCTNQEDLNFFGPGIIVFFVFLKKITMLFIFVALLYGVFSLVTNITGEILPLSCENSQDYLCSYKAISSIDRKSKEGIHFSLQLWLGFASCLVWIFGIKLIRAIGRRKNQQVDELLNSSSDYSIRVTNLPFGSYEQNQIMEYLENLWNESQTKITLGQELMIKSVQLIYCTAEVRKICEELHKSIEKTNSYRDPQKSSSSLKENSSQDYSLAKQRSISLYEQLNAIRMQFLENDSFRKPYATGEALVHFANSQQQTLFLKEFGSHKMTLLKEFTQWAKKKIFGGQELPEFKGNEIIIGRAPEPLDINWHFCECQDESWRVLIVWLVTFLILGISFSVQLLLKKLRQEVSFFSYTRIPLTISLQLFNRIIWNILLLIIDFEKLNTKTDGIVSIMNKSFFSQGVNIIILPILMNLVLSDKLEGTDGLAGQVLDYQIIAFFTMLVFNFVNFPFQVKRIALLIPWIRNKIIKSLHKISGELDSYEEYRDLLTFYEPPNFPIAGAYVYMATIINHAMFYVHLQPTLFFAIILNIMGFYFIKKYLLFARCKIPVMSDLVVFETFMDSMMYAPIIYGSGSLLFTVLEMDGNVAFLVVLPCVLCICVAPVAMFDPFNMVDQAINRLMKVFDNKFEQNEAPSMVAEERTDNNIRKMTNNFGKYLVQSNRYSSRIESYFKGTNLENLLSFQHGFLEVSSYLPQQRGEKFCRLFTQRMENLKTQRFQFFGTIANQDNEGDEQRISTEGYFTKKNRMSDFETKNKLKRISVSKLEIMERSSDKGDKRSIRFEQAKIGESIDEIELTKVDHPIQKEQFEKHDNQ